MTIKQAAFIDSSGSIASVGDYCSNRSGYIYRIDFIDSDLRIHFVSLFGSKRVVPWCDRTLYTKVSK